MAHRGLLLLDDLWEFGTRIMETLRQPLEDRAAVISRAARPLSFPANFMLISAMNPCPRQRAPLFSHARPMRKV